MTIYLKTLNGDLVQLSICSCGPSGKNLKEWISNTERLSIREVVLYHNGLLVQEEDQLKANGVYHISLRLRGGKGGFGSMLRMIGAQIEKTTNHEACRDLSGRRMRDVNNEKKLADWIAKKADREREREERRQAKLERLRSEPKHYFVDPNYDKQKSSVTESLEEAITQGVSVSADEPSSSRGKRKMEAESSEGLKKSRLWIGIEGASDSDDSDEDECAMPVSKSEEEEEEESNAELPQKETEIREHPLSSKKNEISEGDGVKDSVGESQPKSTQTLNGTESRDSKGGTGEPTEETQDTTMEGTALILEDVQSEKDLEAWGLDQLKKELMSRGLKCGGTLQERAQRLFSVKGLSPDQIDPALKAKLSKGKKKTKN
ncbi:Replication stress response regulator SDE2 [Holothuria leucospilota]|uniref:Replication stress response regulator SDE2 n=1 Tax=Holothuria leucospilota TaxID=206669 RepID=A0A9Q1CI77_HOLLE|nr:Replication stress response regulator SDE2 [Holothuria leucospilota]